MFYVLVMCAVENTGRPGDLLGNFDNLLKVLISNLGEVTRTWDFSHVTPNGRERKFREDTKFDYLPTTERERDCRPLVAKANKANTAVGTWREKIMCNVSLV